MAVTAAESVEDFDKALSSCALVVCNFRANWCEPCKDMDVVFAELAREHPDMGFVQVEAEVLMPVSERFGVDVIPTFLIIENGKEVRRMQGAGAPMLVDLVRSVATPASGVKDVAQDVVATANHDGGAPPLDARLKQLIESAPNMLFMKGTPDAPRCGFSRQVVELLREEGVSFGHFDILTDEEVRQGLKTYSNWPTYPQLYSHGKLLGGLDIVREMKEEGELKDALAADTPSLDARLKQLIESSPNMLFMKGSPDAPRCGFSRQVVELLREEGVSFGHFDILTDEEVRQGLKTYSNWPTYPQLYSNGKLLGGLDIVREMKEEGELKDALA